MSQLFEAIITIKKSRKLVVGKHFRAYEKTFDPFAISVVRAGNIIGHMPKKISAACSLFLWNHGTIHCTVIGSR